MRQNSTTCQWFISSSVEHRYQTRLETAATVECRNLKISGRKKEICGGKVEISGKKTNTVIPRLAQFLIARICTARICEPA